MGHDPGLSAEGDYPECLLVCSDFVLSTLSLRASELVEEALAPLDLRLRKRSARLLSEPGVIAQAHAKPASGL
jgi:hypothetical protein